MTDAPLKTRLQEDIKEAMRAKDKPLLDTLRLMMAELKQKEVDERITLKDEDIIAIFDKMAKQHRDSITQYNEAQRSDLAEKEAFELEIILRYMPEQLSEEEIKQLITAAIAEVDAKSMKDMGKVMGLLKSKIQGRADFKVVSETIKNLLST